MALGVRHLQALVAVAEEGSVTRAAKRLHIGQPALTRTLRQYERAVGAALITRTPSGSSLTPEGQTYLTRARSALTAFDRAVENADRPAAITVGYVWSALGLRTNAVFDAWNTKPGNTTTLMLKRFQSRTSGVASGNAEIGIVRYPTPSIPFSAKLFDEPRVVAVPDAHPLAQRDDVSLNDLTNDTIILDGLSGTTTMALWPPAIRPSKPPIVVGSVDEWNHHVSLGDGIGITAESTQHVHPYPGITYIPMHPSTPRIDVHCIWSSPHLTGLAHEFAALVRASNPPPAQPR